MLKRLSRSVFQIAYSAISSNCRFVRTNPMRTKGQSALYYDKWTKKSHSVHCRDLSDFGTADLIFKDHCYDLRFMTRYDELLDHYRNMVRSGKTPVILDLGANIGAASKYFAMEYPEAKVVAVEPEEHNFLQLQKNSEEHPNIKVINAAVGCDRGTVSILNPDAYNTAFQMDSSSDAGNIQLLTVQNLLDADELSSLFIVKVDIEGFESNLFSQNIDWVKSAPLLIVETHDWLLPRQANSLNLLKALVRNPRDFLIRGENIFSVYIQ